MRTHHGVTMPKSISLAVPTVVLLAALGPAALTTGQTRTGAPHVRKPSAPDRSRHLSKIWTVPSPSTITRLVWRFLSPPPGHFASKVGNSDSPALRISYGSRTFLLTDDMEWPMEMLLLGDQNVLRGDVLKVGHHGSRTSTIAPLLDAIAPSVAAISAGYENSFGHPHPTS
jgi:hypothetical protein